MAQRVRRFVLSVLVVAVGMAGVAAGSGMRNDAAAQGSVSTVDDVMYALSDIAARRATWADVGSKASTAFTTRSTPARSRPPRCTWVSTGVGITTT